MKDNEKRRWLALAFCKGLGAKAARFLFQELSNPMKIWESDSAWNRFKSFLLGEDSPDRKFLLSAADREIELGAHHGFRIVTPADDLYPGRLLEISSPPPALFCIGDLHLLKTPGIAVVGTRSPSPYGVDMTHHFTAGLVQHHLTIVSGLAMGIDAHAHRTAIECKGKTIAVLGCGLDQRYPVANRRLRSEIEKSGLVVTEFPWGTRPRPGQFPQRNRIISGLSLATFFIEGREQSGALITANHALEQGRDVFALPGPVTSPVSRGPLRLIQQGAVPVIEIDDIISHLNMLPFVNNTSDRSILSGLNAPPGLPERFTRIWDRLSFQPVSIDDIISGSDLNVADVHDILLEMEMEGWIRQLPGKRYVINPSSSQATSET